MKKMRMKKNMVITNKTGTENLGSHVDEKHR